MSPLGHILGSSPEILPIKRHIRYYFRPQRVIWRFITNNFRVAVWVGYIALFGIAVEAGVVMVVYLHESLERGVEQGKTHSNADIEEAVIEGVGKRLRLKLMTVLAVLASLAPILWELGIGSDVMKPIAAPIVGGMNTSTIHVLILVPVFFVMMKERSLRMGKLRSRTDTVDHPALQDGGQ